MSAYKFESPDYPRSPFNPTSLINGFMRIPDEPGVYIWGYLINVKGKEKFCPINVGQAQDLRNRLYSDHYLGNMPIRSKNRKEEKEIFEFQRTMSPEDVQETYDAMADYDTMPRGSRNPCLKTSGCGCFFCTPIRHRNKLMFFRGSVNLKKMQDPKSPLPPNILGDIKLYDLYSVLSSQHPKHPLCARIEKFHALHKNNFYCIFLRDKGNTPYLAVSKKNRESVEKDVKKILSTELGIETTAKGGKNHKSSIAIDLTCVKDKLIPLPKGRENKYVNQSYNYHKKDELILPKKNKV
jgi:hypothetical protein